jgi:DNA modification methylase
MSSVYYSSGNCVLYHGDVLEILPQLPEASVQTVVTSPPYWGLRDYGSDGQIGLEPTPEKYCANMVAVFREVWRVLKPTGTVWMNLGDSYVANPISANGANEIRSDVETGGLQKGHSRRVTYRGGTLKPKDLVGIPWRVAFALQADGWYLRSDIIWSKPNPMPESVTDRPTKAHEYVFLLTKSPKYYYDADAIRESLAPTSIGRLQQNIEGQIGTTRANGGMKSNGNFKAVGDIEQGRNKRTVWEIDTKYPDATYGGGGTSFRGHSGHYKADGTLIDNPLGRNKRSVWEITTQPYKDAHFATYPEKLVQPCILAGTSEKGVVLDPFCGAGTTGVVAKKLGRHFIGIDIKADYLDMTQKRIDMIPVAMELFAVE